MCIINNREHYVISEILPTIEDFDIAERSLDLAIGVIEKIGFKKINVVDAIASMALNVYPFCNEFLGILVNGCQQVFYAADMPYEAKYMKTCQQQFIDSVEEIYNLLINECVVAASDRARWMLKTVVGAIYDRIEMAYLYDRTSYKKVNDVVDYYR